MGSAIRILALPPITGVNLKQWIVAFSIFNLDAVMALAAVIIDRAVAGNSGAVLPCVIMIFTLINNR